MASVKKISTVLGVIVLLALARLLPHLPNFAPITAMALFGGVYLGRRWAFVVPLAAMAVSDYLLLYVNPFSPQLFNFSHVYAPQVLFHQALPAVYASFLISGFIGLWLKQHKTAPAVVFASALCSLQFFLITNAAVWLNGMYDPSLLGLWQSYVVGLPFLSGTFFGDFFYTCTLFSAYELALAFRAKRTIAFAH